VDHIVVFRPLCDVVDLRLKDLQQQAKLYL
jgi:hypothetical protein